MQKIITLETCSPSLRHEVVGWGGEAADLYVPHRPIGLTPCLHFTAYKTVLEAMADGWKVMAPPRDVSFDRTKVNDGMVIKEKIPYFEWWLTKD